MLSQNDHRATPASQRSKADSVLLREDHLILLLVDGVLAVHAVVSRWFRRWRSRQLLAALDNHTLRDIGLSRADVAGWSGRLRGVLTKRADASDRQRRALADLDDSQLGKLSETGLRAWRAARCERF